MKTKNHEEVDVLILAGGLGSRLRSAVSDRPKAMAIVNGRPFLEYILLYLCKIASFRVILCAGHMADAIENHFADGDQWGLEICVSVEEKPLGTAGAIRRAIGQSAANRFLVMNGDSFCEFDYKLLLEKHLVNKANATIWLTKASDCSRYGSVELDEKDAVSTFREKDSSNREGLISAGIYLLERTLLEKIPENRFVSLEQDVFPGYIGAGLYGVRGSGSFIDIGTPESYAEAEAFLGR